MPELIKCLPDAPPDVVAAAAQLACSSCVLVNLGIDRRDLSEWHWTYFYDEEWIQVRFATGQTFINVVPLGTDVQITEGSDTPPPPPSPSADPSAGASVSPAP